MPPVQQKVGQSSSSLALTVTLDAPPAARNTLLLALSYNSTTGTITSITQTGVTWTQVGLSRINRYAGVYVGDVAANAGTTVSFVFNASASKAANISEWGGYLLTNNGTVTRAASAANAVTGTITTTVSDIMLACMSSTVDGTSPTNSFSALTGDGTNIGAHLSASYREVPATGAYTTGWTSSAGNYDDVLVAIRAQNLPEINAAREIV